VARGGEVQRGWKWDQRVAGVLRGAVEQQEVACSPPRQRVMPLCAAIEEAGREGGGRRLLDFFVISNPGEDVASGGRRAGSRVPGNRDLREALEGEGEADCRLHLGGDADVEDDASVGCH